MSVKLLRKQRAEIVKDFCLRHGGVYNPQTFVEEVRSTGPDHPAYELFTWDDTKAAREHRTRCTLSSYTHRSPPFRPVLGE